MKVWGHTLVKNEERYLWFAVTSVIEHLDKLLLWDTGSWDDTVKIAEKLQKKYPDKIEVKEVGDVDISSFTKVRQKMLDETKSDWILVLDGDEVWWEDSVKELFGLIEKKGNDLETVVTPMINVVGDIFHYQEETAGRYLIDRKIGHMSIRAMNMAISGLHLKRPHGTQGFFDKEGRLIQERDAQKREHMEGKMMHFTHMIRSSTKKGDSMVPKRKGKYKYEIGESFPLDYYFPEAFFKKRPDIVKSPWEGMEKSYYLRAVIETPLRKIKRRVFPSKVGY